MKKLFDAANRFVETSDWKTIAVLKFCLIAIGLMVGIQIKPEHKKPVLFGAAGTFVITYIPLMTRFCHIFREK